MESNVDEKYSFPNCYPSKVDGSSERELLEKGVRESVTFSLRSAAEGVVNINIEYERMAWATKAVQKRVEEAVSTALDNLPYKEVRSIANREGDSVAVRLTKDGDVLVEKFDSYAASQGRKLAAVQFELVPLADMHGGYENRWFRVEAVACLPEEVEGFREKSRENLKCKLADLRGYAEKAGFSWAAIVGEEVEGT